MKPVANSLLTGVSIDDRRRFYLLLSVLSLSLVALLPFFQPGPYLILAFVSFLIVSELFVPVNAETKWWSKLRWVRVVGWVVTIWLLSQRVVETLP